MQDKPYSQACENNKRYILPIIQHAFVNCHEVLEVGSGTGQHAVYFAPNLTNLIWQPSDLIENHTGIKRWLNEFPEHNLMLPITLDLSYPWQTQLQQSYDGIFTANTLHIVSWPLVINFFQGIKEFLNKNGTLCIYGPFKYQGDFTTQSNANFDLWLKARDPQSGVRDFEAICQLAADADLTLIADHSMPANNQLLVFAKIN